MRILLIAVLIIALSIASTTVSFLRIVSYGWQSYLITQHGFPFGWYSIIRHTLGAPGDWQVVTSVEFKFHSEAFIIDTITYITVYSVIATFILWAYHERAKVKVSKFHDVECSMRRMGLSFPSLTFSYMFVALVLISVSICGIIIVIFDVSRIKAKLDELYWIAENTHSFVAPIMIEIVESKLYQKQTILMGLLGLTALTIVSLMLIKRKLTGKAVRDIRSEQLIYDACIKTNH